MENLTLMFLFLLGSIFGSFGSVLLWRMKDEITRQQIKSILVGRSECPGCHQYLTPAQLIPFFGRIWQKGKCFRCHQKISFLYPLLELSCGLVFLVRGMMFAGNFSTLSVLLLVVWYLLALLAIWDIHSYELHMPVYIGLALTMLGYLSVIDDPYRSILSGLVFLGVFLGIYFFGKWYTKLRFGVAQEAFGLGDVLLAPILGILLSSGIHTGVLAADFLLIVYFVLGACLCGVVYYAIVTLYYYIMKKDNSDAIHETGAVMIPFLPAMIVSYGILLFLF